MPDHATPGVIAALACGALAAALPAPASGQRTVQGNAILSAELPAADIRVDPALEHIGSTSFVLYGVTDVDMNARFYPPSGFAGRPGSDGDHARRLLEEHGLELGSDLARVRLVWLLGDPPRDELMLIYLEDLEALGLDVAALEEDAARWERLAADLLERASESFTLSPR